VRGCVPAAVACCLALAGANSYAEVTATLSVGLGGRSVGGCWNAASLAVLNPDGSQDGAWQIAVYERLSGQGEGTPSSAYEIPVRVPHGSSRTDFALLLPNWMPHVRYRLMVQGRALVDGTTDLDVLRWQKLTLLVTSREGLSGSLALAQSSETITLRPEQLPLDVRAYSSLDVIGLDVPDLRTLAPQALDCLREWTLTGGTLVLTAPCLQGNRATPSPLAAFTPALATGMAACGGPGAAAAALCGPEAPAPVSVQCLRLRVNRPDVAVEADGLPLAFEQPLGMGTVRGLAIDPLWMRFPDDRSEINFTRYFWGRVLYGVRYEPRLSQQVPTGLVPTEARPARSAPVLLAILALFVLAVGPLNGALLARRRRHEWVVVTAPVLSGIFLLAVAAAALGLHGHRPLLVFETINVTHAGTPGTGTLELAGAYLPASGTQDVVFPRRDATVYEFRQRERSYELGVEPGTWFRLADEVSLPALPVRRWAMRAFCDTAIAGEASAEGELQFAGDRLVGWVQSRLPVALHDCYVIHKWNHTFVGDLPAGERRELSLKLGPPEVSEYDLARLPSLTDASAYTSGALWGRELKGRGWELWRAATEIGCLNGVTEPILVGWGPPAVETPRLEGTRKYRVEGEHLYVVELPLAASGQALSIPVGGALFAESGWRSRWLTVDPLTGRTPDSVPSGYVVTYEFGLPIDVRNAHHEALAVEGQLRPPFGGAGAQNCALSLYEWDRREWVAIGQTTRDRFTVPVPRPERFIRMPMGLVRLRLGAAAARGYPDVVWADLTYRGKALAP
jgi:hypothetical protein